MSRPIVVADLYGLGGYATSPGMLTLAQKIKALGPNVTVLGPYDQGDWQTAAADLARAGPSTLLAAIGYSLGANNVVLIASALAQGRRSVAYLAGIQPSYWGLGSSWAGRIVIPPNVALARNVYNPVFAATGGLGFCQYQAPAGFAGRILYTPNSDLHPAVDNDAGVHGLILADLKGIMA